MPFLLYEVLVAPPSASVETAPKCRSLLSLLAGVIRVLLMMPLFFHRSPIREVSGSIKAVARTLANGSAVPIGSWTFAAPRENKWDDMYVLKSVRECSAITTLG